MLSAIRKSQFWFTAALFTIIAAAAYGQTFRGAINGTVTDATGAVVPKANVTVTNTGTSVSQSMVTTDRWCVFISGSSARLVLA